MEYKAHSFRENDALSMRKNKETYFRGDLSISSLIRVQRVKWEENLCQGREERTPKKL